MRTLVAALAGFGGLLLPTGAVAAPVAATGERVLVSVDGHRWSGDLARPLFDPVARWSPGMSRIETLWVRNAGPGPARLHVTTRVGDHDGLVGGGALDVALRGSTGRWSSLPPGEARVAMGALAAGASRRIEVRAALAPAAGADTQRARVRLDLDVTLTGDGGDGGDGSGPGAATTSSADPSGGGVGSEEARRREGAALPATGAPAVGWLVALGGACLGTGLGLVTRRRKDHL